MTEDLKYIIEEEAQLGTRIKVIGVGGAETAKLPFERSDVHFPGAAEAGLDGARHHLLQWRIGYEEGRDDARPCWIGAAKLQRRGGAIGLRIAGIGRQLRRDLVGSTDDRIEAIVC